MNIVTVVTISMLLALVAGGTVWVVWSVLENLSAAKKKRAAPNEAEQQ